MNTLGKASRGFWGSGGIGGIVSMEKIIGKIENDEIKGIVDGETNIRGIIHDDHIKGVVNDV